MSIPLDLYEHPKVKAAMDEVHRVLRGWADSETRSKAYAADWANSEGRVTWGEAVLYLMSPGWPVVDLGERLASLLLSADRSWCWDTAYEVERLPGEPLVGYFARVDAEAVVIPTGIGRFIRSAADANARADRAESALAILQTPLSPEALQAIAEESAE